MAIDQGGASEQATDAAAASWREAGAINYSSDVTESVRCYEAALELQPDNPMNACDLGYSYIRAGRQDDALAAFQHVMDASAEPELRSEALRGIGIVTKFRGEYELAREHLDRAPAIARDAGYDRGSIKILLASALINLGIVMAVADNYEEADFILNRALEIHESCRDLAGQALVDPSKDQRWHESEDQQRHHRAQHDVGGADHVQDQIGYLGQEPGGHDVG